MALKITPNNYNYYREIYSVIWTHYSKLLPPEILQNGSPIDLLDKWEMKSKSIARKGLKESLRDTLSSIHEMPAELLNQINIDLLNRNLPGIQSLLGLVKDTVIKVLKRGRVKNIDEFYIIKEIVIDQTSTITDNERLLLDKYMTEFELGKRQ